MTTEVIDSPSFKLKWIGDILAFGVKVNIFKNTKVEHKHIHDIANVKKRKLI